MATNTSWMQRAQTRIPHVPKLQTPRQEATFTSLRVGQYPHHPHKQPTPKMDAPPNFGDQGDAAAMAPLTRENLPDSMMFPGMLPEDGSQPPVLPPDEDESVEPSSASDPTSNANVRNQGVASSPNPPLSNPTTPDALNRELAKFPERTPPKWWQRVGAGAVGALAGIANAGGHMRHPIDVSGAAEGILHPGYQDKLETWRSRVIPQELQLQLAAQMRQAQLAQQKQASEAQLKQAQGEQAMAQAKRYAALADHYAAQDANASVVATPELVKASGGAIALGQKVPTAVARDVYKQAATAAAKMTVLKPGDVAFQGGNKIAENTNQKPAGNVNEWAVRQAAANGEKWAVDALRQRQQDQINARIASRAPRDPLAHELAEQRLEDSRAKGFDTIEQQKQAALSAAQRQFNVDHDENQYAANAQRAQTAYEAAIQRHGGTVQPLQVRPKSGMEVEYAPRGQSGTGARKYTEQEVRQRATAAGKDGNAAVKAARDKGLLQ